MVEEVVDTGVPHCGQNRALLGISAEQAWHIMLFHFPANFISYLTQKNYKQNYKILSLLLIIRSQKC
jgi:hypothetical protein